MWLLVGVWNQAYLVTSPSALVNMREVAAELVRIATYGVRQLIIVVPGTDRSSHSHRSRSNVPCTSSDRPPSLLAERRCWSASRDLWFPCQQLLEFLWMHWTGVSDGLCICLWWLFVGIEICDSSLCDSIFSHSYIHRVHTNIHIIHHNATHIIHHNKHPQLNQHITTVLRSYCVKKISLIARQPSFDNELSTINLLHRSNAASWFSATTGKTCCRE